mmetsp:Transcript_13185/g.42966  ORF Transcript_13185/g.42966 Transcript_13185/m.42966 type:complete len:218 (+) Transcript_13185:477-1130(+)
MTADFVLQPRATAVLVNLNPIYPFSGVLAAQRAQPLDFKLRAGIRGVGTVEVPGVPRQTSGQLFARDFDEGNASWCQRVVDTSTSRCLFVAACQQAFLFVPGAVVLGAVVLLVLLGVAVLLVGVPVVLVEPGFVLVLLVVVVATGPRALPSLTTGLLATIQRARLLCDEADRLLVDGSGPSTRSFRNSRSLRQRRLDRGGWRDAGRDYYFLEKLRLV